MAAPESEHIYGIQLRESANDGSDFSNGDVDYRVIFLGEDGLLHAKDSSGTVTGLGGSGLSDPMTTRGDIIVRNSSNVTARLAVGGASTVLSSDGTDVSWQAAAGSTYTGQPIIVVPPMPLTGVGNFTNASAGFGWATIVNVPAPMKVRGMGIEITSAGSGSIQWGLFDGSSTPTAATKVCGGSAAPGGTGHRVIAATSAPVSINPGGYVLIWKMPDTNASTIRTIVTDSAVAVPWNQIWTSYTWDDTPDLTSSSWVVTTTMSTIYLEGDVDGSGTRWT